MNNNFQAQLVKKFHNYDIVQDPGHQEKREFLTRIIQLPFPPSVGMRITQDFKADLVEWNEDSQSFYCEENEISLEVPEATFDWILTEYTKWNIRSDLSTTTLTLNKQLNNLKKQKENEEPINNRRPEEHKELLHIRFIMMKTYPHHRVIAYVNPPSWKEENIDNVFSRFQRLCAQTNTIITLYDEQGKRTGYINSNAIATVEEYKAPKIVRQW